MWPSPGRQARQASSLYCTEVVNACQCEWYCVGTCNLYSKHGTVDLAASPYHFGTGVGRSPPLRPGLVSVSAFPTLPVSPLPNRPIYPFHRLYKMPSTSFQPILEAAFADYVKQTGIDLAGHPFAARLPTCNSPDDVLKQLEEKANEFKDYREGNRKLIDCLKPVVNVIHTFSGVLGEAVSLVSRIVSFSLFIFSPVCCYQIPFKPAKAIFVGVDILLAVRVP
jgi:hypothetical protein